MPKCKITVRIDSTGMTVVREFPDGPVQGLRESEWYVDLPKFAARQTLLSRGWRSPEQVEEDRKAHTAELEKAREEAVREFAYALRKKLISDAAQLPEFADTYLTKLKQARKHISSTEAPDETL